jgi:transposase
MQELPMTAQRTVPRRDPLALEARRMEAARLLRRGLSQSEVARRVGATPTSVWRWVRTVEDKGRRGLRRAERIGRPPRLSAAERARVVTALEAGARAHGYATDLWTLARVGKLIEAVTGQQYSHSGAWRLLQRLGFSCWRSPGRLVQREEASIYSSVGRRSACSAAASRARLTPISEGN